MSAVGLILPAGVSPPVGARTVVTYVPIWSPDLVSLSEDDIKVDYTSMLGMEERRQRFSEEVEDIDLKDSVRMQKMYRLLQRQVYCGARHKARVFPMQSLNK